MSSYFPFRPTASCTLGPWLLVMDIITYVAVVSNAAIVALELLLRSEEGLVSLTATTVISIIILEHVVFLSRLLISYSIQDVPGFVERLKYKVRLQGVSLLGTAMTLCPAESSW